MKDLLKRWAELEPALCKYTKNDVNILINGLCVSIYTTPFDADMFVQYAVQQAIEARGLNWDISYLVDESEPPYGGSQHTASVFTYGKRYVREGQISAAGAILSAYLKALEAGIKGDPTPPPQ